MAVPTSPENLPACLPAWRGSGCWRAAAHGAAPAPQARGRARAEGRRWRRGPRGLPGGTGRAGGFSRRRREGGRPLRLPAGGACGSRLPSRGTTRPFCGGPLRPWLGSEVRAVTSLLVSLPLPCNALPDNSFFSICLNIWPGMESCLLPNRVTL